MLEILQEKIAKHKLYAESQKAQREELEGQIEEREQDYKKKMDRITTYENEYYDLVFFPDSGCSEVFFFELQSPHDEGTAPPNAENARKRNV
jgi:hypothetical protein